MRAPASGGATKNPLPDVVAGNGKLYLAIDGELPVEETEEEFVLEKPKLQNFKEELEQEEREKAEAQKEIEAETEVEEDVEEDAKEDADKETEVEEDGKEKDTGDKPNFYEVIKELKKKKQNNDKNLSYSDNSNNNSFILNNR